MCTDVACRDENLFTNLVFVSVSCDPEYDILNPWSGICPANVPEIIFVTSIDRSSAPSVNTWDFQIFTTPLPRFPLDIISRLSDPNSP